MWRLLYLFSLISLFAVTGRVKGLYLSIPLFILGHLFSRFKDKGLYFLLFILPFINALSYFLHTGFPFNYYAPSIFLLAGFLFDRILKNLKLEIPFYRDFLLILFISFLFVFLRWSNITLSPIAFFRDTPVTTTGERLSFGAFFPVLSLAIYSLSPLSLFLFENINRKKAYRLLSLGTLVSFFIALIQISGSKLMLSLGTHKGISYNGGFSDTPGAGTFSGILFALILCNYKELKDLLFLLPPFFMVCVSGSRSGFLLILFSALLFIFNKNIDKKLRLGTILIIVLLSLTPFFKPLKKRIIPKIKIIAKKSYSIEKNLDIITSKRFTLYKKAFVVLKTYPLSGVGTGIFYLYNKYRFKDRINDIAPSLYFAHLTELGVIGELFFLLFLISFAIGGNSPERKVLHMLLIIFLFNNALWNPEVAILFWILLSGIKPKNFNFGKWLSPAFLTLFIISSLLTFNSLHPAKWAVKKNSLYDYGFWHLEDNFRWTKKAAGVYKVFHGEKIKLKSGYPFEKAKRKKQIVNVYWKGKFLKEIVLTPEEREATFTIKGEGFLEFRVKPWFRPVDYDINADSRELGVQLSGIWEKFFPKKKKLHKIKPRKKRR